MRRVAVGGEVSEDAVAGILECVGGGAVFDDDAPGVGAGGVDEADGAVGVGDEEGDMVVEADDVDAGAEGEEFVDEAFVVGVDADVHFLLGEEGAEDVLGGLLGEGGPFEFEAGVLEDGGDEVAAGDFVGAGLVGSAVEVPRGAEPAFHEGGEGPFEERAGAEEGGVLIFGSLGGVVFVAKTLPVVVEFLDESEVGGEIRGGGGFGFRAGFIADESDDVRAVGPAEADRCPEEEQDEEAAEEFHERGGWRMKTER